MCVVWDLYYAEFGVRYQALVMSISTATSTMGQLCAFITGWNLILSLVISEMMGWGKV